QNMYHTPLKGTGIFPPLRQVIRVMVSGWENPLVDNLITLSSIQWRGPRCHVSLSIVDYSWFSRIWLNAPNLVLSLFSLMVSALLMKLIHTMILSLLYSPPHLKAKHHTPGYWQTAPP